MQLVFRRLMHHRRAVEGIDVETSLMGIFESRQWALRHRETPTTRQATARLVGLQRNGAVSVLRIARGYMRLRVPQCTLRVPK
jgi:hypothetical protein